MNRAKRIATVAFAAVALLGANLATATTVQKFTLSDLAKKSESIVLARVEDQSSRWDDNHKEIYTFITLHVLEPVKGAKGETTITLRQLGGSVDNLISVVPGMPTFRKGEEVVLFLSPKDGAGYPWVMGLQQGKYTVVTDANGIKHVRNDVDGLKTLAPNGTVSEAKVSTEQPLSAFLDGIKTQLDLEGKVQVDPTTPTE
jgi:hypothetical protein